VTSVLLYDRDCGFCTQSARAVHRLGCEVDTVPWQEWDQRAARGLSDEALAERVHLVDGDDVHTGHAAVGVVLRRSRLLPVRLAGSVVLAPPLRPLASRVYDWVAAHRHQLPGGTAACALEPPPRS
jgi:predicted DCC family thiol-disulfide oxidoreductase YuxK